MERGRFARAMFERRERKTGKRRLSTAHLISRIFPYELTADSSPLDAARTHIEDGYGVVILYNHFSKSDHIRAAAVVVDEIEALRARRILSPVALHHYGTPVKLLGRYGRIELQPVVTDDTRERFKEKSKELPSREEAVEEAKKYKNIAREVLSEGGMIAIAPQIGRRKTLGKPEGKVLRRFLEGYDSNRVVFLFVGLGIPELTDYGQEDIKGYNVRKSFSVKFGRPMTRIQLEVEAGVRRINIDEMVFDQLAKVVPPEYASAGRASQT